MITKATMTKLEAQGYTINDLIKSWDAFEKLGFSYREWCRMMKVRAENP